MGAILEHHLMTLDGEGSTGSLRAIATILTVIDQLLEEVAVGIDETNTDHYGDLYRGAKNQDAAIIRSFKSSKEKTTT